MELHMRGRGKEGGKGREEGKRRGQGGGGDYCLGRLSA